VDVDDVEVVNEVHVDVMEELDEMELIY